MTSRAEGTSSFDEQMLKQLSRMNEADSSSKDISDDLGIDENTCKERPMVLGCLSAD